MGMTILVEIDGDFLAQVTKDFEHFGMSVYHAVAHGKRYSTECREADSFSGCIKEAIPFHRHDTQAHKDWMKFKKKHGGG